MVNQQKKSALGDRVTVMDSTKWYFAAHGNGYGPFTFEQLQQLARTEMISPSNFVWQQDETESRHVKDIDGLLRDFVPTQSPSRSHRTTLCVSAALVILGGFLAFYFYGDGFQKRMQSGNSETSATSQPSDQATATVIAETSPPPQPSALPPRHKPDVKPANDDQNAHTSSAPAESIVPLRPNPTATRVTDSSVRSNPKRRATSRFDDGRKGVDVLESVDPKRHTLLGKWTREGRSLVSHASKKEPSVIGSWPCCSA